MVRTESFQSFLSWARSSQLCSDLILKLITRVPEVDMAFKARMADEISDMSSDLYHIIWSGYGTNGWIQTLFLGILKSLNIEILTKPSESTSKMSQKLEKMRSRDFQKFLFFLI